MASARNNQRKRKRRGRFGFLYKLLAIAALGAALFLGAGVFFRVEKVVVNGNVHYTAQEIVDASGVVQGDRLFSLNRFEINRKMQQQLPYIDTVSFSMGLPDTFILTVTENRAAAWVAGGEGDYLLSTSGKVLECVPSGTAAGIELKGLDGPEMQVGSLLAVQEEQRGGWTGLLELMGALESQGMLDKVSQVDLCSAIRITMRYDGRFTVRLPVSGDFDYLLRAMETVAESQAEYETGVMDLTMKDYTVALSPE